MVALSGIAKIYAESFGCHGHEYVAGLWKHDLIRELLWYTKGSALIDNRAHTTTFPSWSWASAGYVQVDNRWRNRMKFVALSSVTRVDVHLTDQHEPFGSIKEGGSITLRGPVKRLPRLYNKEWSNASIPISKLEWHLSKRLEAQSHPSTVPLRYSSPPMGGHYAVLQMLKDS